MNTSTTRVVLTELELDALTELVNLGISTAAFSLREMVHQEVLLTVPKVAIVMREEAIETLRAGAATRVVAIHQQFDGEIAGRALLIFPEVKSLELVRALVGKDLTLDQIVELEHEALAETGNVLLNSCLSTLANNLKQTLRISLPEVVHAESAELLSLSPEQTGDGVVFIHIDFTVRLHDISGFFAMLLDLPSLVALKGLLNAFIERTTGVRMSRPEQGA